MPSSHQQLNTQQDFFLFRPSGVQWSSVVFETELMGIALTPVVKWDAKRATLIQVLLENS